MSRPRDLRFRKSQASIQNKADQQVPPTDRGKPLQNTQPRRNKRGRWSVTISRHCLKSASTIISERKKCGSHWWIKLGNLIRYAKSHSIFRREPKVIVVEVRPLLWRAVGSIEDEARSHPCLSLFDASDRGTGDLLRKSAHAVGDWQGDQNHVHQQAMNQVSASYRAAGMDRGQGHHHEVHHQVQGHPIKQATD